jgi:hypothetical protein
VEAQQLRPEDWRAFREIRLAMLADAPQAFGSTLDEAVRLAEADWRQRLAGRTQFVVRQSGRAVGTAGGFVEDARRISSRCGWIRTGGGAGSATYWSRPC